MSKIVENKVVGRKSREQKGWQPVKNTTVSVEESVMKLCKKKYGSYSNAMRFAALYKGVIPASKELISSINDVR